VIKPAKCRAATISACGNSEDLEQVGVADTDHTARFGYDPRLRAEISPSYPTQDVHFADTFNAISPAEHSACSANLYG
jgi:hypothetical protein